MEHIYYNLMFEYHVVSLKIHQENLLPILSLFTQKSVNTCVNNGLWN